MLEASCSSCRWVTYLRGDHLSSASSQLRQLWYVTQAHLHTYILTTSSDYLILQWIGLCITQSFVAFETISFICGVTTVTPQLMIPLIGDFAPNHRKQVWISIVVSGLLLGMLVARVLSGVVANYTSWRNIYWISCAAQYVLVALLFVFMPDYPSTNPEGLSYLKALWSIVYMMFTEPVLVQACLIVFCFSCVFTSFWTTLTFLLAEPPYEYSTVDIGLFALIGLIALVTIPLYARLMDRYVPMLSILCGQFILLSGVTISTAISTFTVAGPIIHAIAVDVGIQIGQVSNRAVIFNINPKARNRVNTAYMVLAFAGQLTGTAVGNKLFAEGGWRWSSGCSSKSNALRQHHLRMYVVLTHLQSDLWSCPSSLLCVEARERPAG